MSPRLLLGGALGFTLVFNVVWACADGVDTPQRVLSVAAAAVCTLIVPAGLHLWPKVPAPTLPLRILRAVVMVGICASAAITSFSHSVEVLLVAGWTDLTAWSVTGGAELLVALSTMALRTDHTTPATSPVLTVADAAHHLTVRTAPDELTPTAEPVPPPTGIAPPPEPAAPPPTTPPAHTASHGDDLLREAVVWAREEAGDDGDTPGWRRIVREFPQLSEHRAKNAAREARTTHPGYLRSVQ